MIGMVVEEADSSAFNRERLIYLIAVVVAGHKGVDPWSTLPIFQENVLPVVDVARDRAVHLLFNSSSQPVILILSCRATWEGDLNELILRIPGVGGDITRHLVSLGFEIPVGVVGVGKGVVFEKPIGVVMGMCG